MAEYEYLIEEETDITVDLIPCEFCDELFPIDIFIEHSSGCNPSLFRGTAEPDPPQVVSKPVKEPVTKPQVAPEPKLLSFPVKQNENVLLSTAKNSPSIKIEHLVINDIYDIKPKSGGGSIMKRLSDVENQKEINSVMEYKHFKPFKTEVQEQGESDSDEEEEEETSKFRPDQGKTFSSVANGSSQGLDAEDSVELSDDDNEENETIESFLRQASITLSKIKQNQQRAASAKWKESQYARYSHEEAYYQYHDADESENIYSQNYY